MQKKKKNWEKLQFSGFENFQVAEKSCLSVLKIFGKLKNFVGPISTINNSDWSHEITNVLFWRLSKFLEFSDKSYRRFEIIFHFLKIYSRIDCVAFSNKNSILFLFLNSSVFWKAIINWCVAIFRILCKFLA